MRILLWPTHYLPHIGGLEVMTHHLAVNLQKAGHQVWVITNQVADDEFVEKTIDEIKIFTFPFVNALYHHRFPLIKKILQRINQLITDFDPHILNVHGWFECFCFYQIRVLEKHPVPLVITVHGLLEQKKYDSLACAALWNKAKAVTVVSKGLIAALNQYKISHSTLKVIYNGIPALQSPIRTVDMENPICVMIGRLSEEKCFDIAFYAIKQLADEGLRFKVFLVGGGILFDYLSDLKTQLGLDSYIKMTGFVPPKEVKSYIEKASIVIIPSHYESFSLVALEAAMYGRPVVASRVLGLKEVVEHNKTGILVEPKNPLLLANAIKSLLNKSEEAKQMGINARERALSLFTIDKTTQEYISTYKCILENSDGTAFSQCHYSSL